MVENICSKIREGSYLVIATFLIIITSVTFAQEGPPAQKAKYIGTIAGMVVTKEEVLREMERYRADVYRDIATEDPGKQSGSFWDKEIRGIKAIDILRTRAIDSLSVIKVQEKLLRERNLWPYKDYESLLKDLEVNNRNRKKSVAGHEVIYGPIEFSEQTFFDYCFSNALIRLKNSLVNEKLIVITEVDLQNQFKKMQNTVYKEDKYTLKAFTRQVKDAYIEVAYKALINKYVKHANNKIDSGKLNQIRLTE